MTVRGYIALKQREKQIIYSINKKRNGINDINEKETHEVRDQHVNNNM